MPPKHKKAHIRDNYLGKASESNQTEDQRSLRIVSEKANKCFDCRLSKRFCPQHENHKEKLIQHLIPLFETFNSREIIQELKLAFEIDNTLHLEIPVKIRSLSRRHELPRFLLLPILHDLKDPSIDLPTRIHLAQAVKYGVVKNLDVQYEELLEVLQGNCPEIKSEIVWALGHKVELSFERPPQELINRMKTELTKDIDSEAKSFLKGRITKGINRKGSQENQKNVKFSRKNLNAKKQHIATKNQQVTKSHQKNFESQELNIETSSILDKLKNRQKKRKLDSKIEKLPEEIKENKGSDVSFFRGTFTNTKKIYDRAKSLLDIKDEDKDRYLTDKFLDGSKYWTGGLLGDLITDRMIAAIFNIISKRQRLTERTIKKLMLCLNDSQSLVLSSFQILIENLAKNMLSLKKRKTKKEIMIEMILTSSLPEAPQEMKNFSNKMKEIKNLKTLSDSDRENIWKLFLEEVDMLRRDSISALYNCALRDKRILTPEFLKKLENCLDDPNKNIKGLAVKIYAVLKDSQEINYAKVFTSCLRQLEENIEREQSLDYIDQQSKDPKRCKELFTDEIILRLSNLLKSSSYCEKFKFDCIGVILNYLEQSFARGLELQVLTNLCLIIKDKTFDEKGERNEIKDRGLISILLTAEKEKSLPKEIIQFLGKEMKNLDDYSANFIIIILGTICENSKISHIEEISSKLLNNCVIIGEGSTLTFEPLSSENSSETAISAITAKIILSTLNKGVDKVSSEVVRDLIDALASHDIQTKIHSSRAIAIVSDHNAAEFSQDNLTGLENSLTDDIPDVAIYSKNAYTKILRELSQGNIVFSSNHLEVLAKIYVDEDLVLGKKDFSPVIKKNVLTALANQANKQSFSEGVMNIFNEIFMLDDSRIKEALSIMKNYTNKTYKLPKSTIAAIENVLGKFEFTNEALNLLESIIENGQAANDQTLKIFADNLYLSNDEDEKLRFRSFEVLEKADENQDLSDGIFKILELERAGRKIGSGAVGFEDALMFLENQTQDGKKLPFSVLKALSKNLQNSQVFLILVNVTTNGQLLPVFMIKELSKIFHPESKQLMKIFFNLAKNNQDIPTDLLNQLENSRGDKADIEETLFIFAYWVQRGKKLSPNLIKRISDKFFSTENQAMKHECLSLFVSIIQTHKDLSQKLAEKVLMKGLIDEDEYIVRTSLKGFDFLCAKKTRLNENCIEALVRKTVYSTCSFELRQEIGRLLNSQELIDHQKNLLKLATLGCEPTSKFLECLIEILENGGNLLERNFQQIKIILNESSAFQERTISMLILYVNKKDIPEFLINSIAAIALSTSNSKLKTECLDLIEKIVEVRRVLPVKTVSLIMALTDTNQVLLKKIGQNQDLPEIVNFSLRINSILDSTKSSWLQSLAQNVSRRARAWISKLDSGVEGGESDENLQEYALIFAQAVLKDSQYAENTFIVETIERSIQTENINLKIIQAYGKLIKYEKCKRLLESLDILVRFFLKKQDEEENSKVNWEILLCVSNAVILGAFCEKGIELMERNLTNSEAKIRMKCFQGLSAEGKQGYKSKIFDAYRADLLKKLKAHVKIPAIPDLNLFEALACSGDLNLSKLRGVPQDDWIRELLLLRILAKIETNYSQKIYREWLETEKDLRAQNLDSNLILKALIESQPFTFENLEQVIKFLRKVEFNKAKKILLESLDPFQELKQQWLIGLLTKCLNNLQINKDYIVWLASILSLKLTPSVIEKLLVAISKVENCDEFESLIDFVEENKIKLNDIYVKNSSVCDLKRSLEIKLLGDRITSPINRYKFATVVDKLLEKNWTFDKLMDMFQNIESLSVSKMRSKEQTLLQILKIINHYKISVDKFEKILKILDDNVDEWIQKANEIAIESCFSTTQEKTDLLADLEKVNPLNTSSQDLNLAKAIEQINDSTLMSCIEFKSQLKKRRDPISEWTEADILTWTKIVKSDSKYWSSSSFLVEALAVIKRANLIRTTFHMTDAQIISCIVQLNAHPGQGRLLQVGTGEGKSTIVSVIAIIHALQGKKVDIITSSPVLAERDAKDKARLYRMFDLSCMDNCDKSLYIKGQKVCYKHDIVYGEIAQFQFDTLRDQYSMLGTLAGRKCEVAIVDEVDSMLIDDSSNIARLSSTIAGMDLLQPFIHFIWKKLNNLQERFIVVNGKSYLLSNKAVEIPNNIEKLEQSAKEIEGDVEKALREELENHLKEDLINKGRVTVPKNFQKFVDKQIYKWIDHAIVALINQENHQYIIQEGVIKPVAFDSTGVVQSDTSFGDGLHQFLQRKHGRKMTSETFTTNFLSNIGYIKKYGSNLFGLTGTLGSKRAKEVLSEVYDVDLVIIPNLYKKKYLKFPKVISKDSNEWLEEICESTLIEVRKERGTLIICQTIEHCQRVVDKLALKYRAGAIKLYTMNNMNQEREIDKINPGEIIVATNLAGRGTDINTEEIEKKGGLHVIVTFLPSNQRVEDQAFGRTARQGKLGTGQMILDRTALLQYGNASLQKIKEMRDDYESVMFDQFLKTELPIINTKDELFMKFCKLKNQVHEKMKANTSLWEKLKNFGSSVYETNMLNALEERWALFLHKIDNGIIPLEQSDEKYNVFEKEILEDFGKNQLIKNAYYHISIANELLASKFLSEFKDDQALENLENAIGLDSQHSAAAFVGKAWLAIKTKKSGQKKSQIMNELIEALKRLSDEIALFIDLQAALQQENSDMSCDLSKQLIQKTSILGSYMNSIKQAVTVIRKSQRLIDITGTKYFERKNHTGNVIKTTSKFYDLERDDLMKETLQKIRVHDKFTVAFNDLTITSDLGDPDQAIQTIDKFDTSQGILNELCQKAKSLFKNSSDQDPPSYKDLALTIKGLNIEELKRMLDPDIKMMNIHKEIALSKLKEHSKSCQVELESVVGSEKQTKKSLKVKDAIKILENEKDEEIRFNIFLENANADKNKKTTFIKKATLKGLTLTLEYPSLDCETAKKKLQKIQSESLILEISGIKTEILKTLLKIHTKHVQLLILRKDVQLLTLRKDDVVETVEIDVARKRISEVKDGQIAIKLEDLERKLAYQIIEDSPNSVFKMTFVGVNPSQTPENFEGETINLAFTKMTSAIAKKLIRILRKSSIDFTLQFDNLSAEQLKVVIEKASLDQENLTISKVKTLSDLFMENARPNLELSEFAARGIEYIFEINEKSFIPWRSILTVVAIGSLQIALGGILISTGLGATLGMGLITEGAADYVTAIRAYCKRSFQWSDYFKQKAVSLAISAASIGLSSIKDAAKGLQTVVSGVKKEVLEQAGTQLIVNPSTAVEGAKSLKKLALQHITVSTSQAVAREGLNQMTDVLCNLALEQFKPKISSFIQEKILAKFTDESFRILIGKMYALDKIRKRQDFSKRINNILQRIISSENSSKSGSWDSIGTSLCRGFLSDAKYLNSSSSIETRIIGSLSGLAQVTLMTDNIFNQLFKELSEMDKESLSIHQILHNYRRIPLADAQEISEILKAKDVVKTHSYKIPQFAIQVSKAAKEIDLSGKTLIEKARPMVKAFQSDSGGPQDCEFMNKDKFGDLSDPVEKGIYKPTIHNRVYGPKNPLEHIDFGKQKEHKKAVLEFCEDLNKYAETMDFSEDFDLSQIMKSISDKITDQIIRVTESHLISPWSSFGVAQLTNHVSATIQTHLIKNQLKSEMEKKSKCLNELEAKENKTLEELNKIAEYKAELEEKGQLMEKQQVTYADQITYEAKKYIIAYSQCEGIDNLNQSSSNMTFLDEKTIWQFKNAIETIKTVMVGINLGGNLIIKVTKNAAAPYIVPILSVANLVKTFSIRADAAFEIIKSGFENGILSKQFVGDVIHQAAENRSDFFDAADKIQFEFTDKIRSLLEKIEKMKKMDKENQQSKKKNTNLFSDASNAQALLGLTNRMHLFNNQEIPRGNLELENVQIFTEKEKMRHSSKK